MTIPAKMYNTGADYALSHHRWEVETGDLVPPRRPPAANRRTRQAAGNFPQSLERSIAGAGRRWDCQPQEFQHDAAPRRVPADRGG